jgi:transposase
MRVADTITLTAPERRKLERIVKSRSAAARLIERSRIALLASDGLNNLEIAERIGTNAIKVGRWRKRFAASGFVGIERDAYRPGRIPALDRHMVERVVEKTTREKPRGATHWSAARMASELGISESSVLRIWRRHGLKPHQTHAFKISNDPQFVEKLEDVTAHAQRMVEVPQPRQCANACGQRDPSRCRQLCDAQTPSRPSLAKKTSAFSHALYTNERFVAQYGRALFSRSDDAERSSRCLSIGLGAYRRHRRTHRSP